MNANSFKDRNYVIPCQALAKKAKNYPSKPSKSGKNTYFHLIISRISSLNEQFLQPRILPEQTWLKLKSLSKIIKACLGSVKSGNFYTLVKPSSTSPQFSEIMDLEFHSRSKILSQQLYKHFQSNQVQNCSGGLTLDNPK